MKNVRTLNQLRERVNCKIYIYLENEKICRLFFQNAENEGYTFGKTKPTENHISDIISLEYDNQLSYVGYIGRIAFQCNGGDNHDNLCKVNYRKYISGDNDYII